MKKYKIEIILLITLIIIRLFIKIPNYVELNNLAIIENIEVECLNNSYKIRLKEIIPIKDDNGIEYDNKYYEEEGKSLKQIKKLFKDKNNKKIYYQRIKSIKTNCKTTDSIKKTFDINPKTIIHKKELEN